MKNKKQNTNKGITLVALVITIIVLLILAGVAINMAINSDGLFGKANEAADKWNTAVVEEGQIMKDLINELYKTPTGIYVTLYEDGTLAFSNNDEKIEGKIVSKSYGDIKGEVYTDEGENAQNTPWYADRASIKEVKVINEIIPRSTSFWFYECSEITNMDLSKLYTGLVTSMYSMFYDCTSLETIDVSNFDTSSVTNMSCMFYGCTNLETIDVSNFDTSCVTNMVYMFGSVQDAMALKNIIGLENFNTSNVTLFDAMFTHCENLTKLNLRNFNTSEAKGMAWMFGFCSKLESIEGLDTFVTNKVSQMRGMFCDCVKLKSLNLSNFNTSNVTYMEKMFMNCNSLTILDLSNFNTKRATNYHADMLTGVTAPVTIGADWNTSMTETATGYSGTFTTKDAT